MKTQRKNKSKKEEVNMSSENDTGSGIGGSYINIYIRKKFSECKVKTEALASQQG